ncbi:MAG: site-2 protease family protein [Synergistaceae bacterium]|nr:site-2 protease family protein [Synergistaceae bacterium]
MNIVNTLLRLPGLLWALSFHEFCHGWMAFKMGDDTAALQGRLSLNPLHHLDPVGTLMLLFFRFGWAKPVQINSRKFRNPRRDIALVALAGPVGNFISAFAVAIICGVLARLSPGLLFQRSGFPTTFGWVMVNMMFMNVGLGIFNLIPVPPLDGSKVLSMFLPVSALRAFFFMERWGFFIIIALVYLGILTTIMNPFFSKAYSFLFWTINFIGGAG